MTFPARVSSLDFLHCSFLSFTCIFWCCPGLELKPKREAAFPFLLEMDRFAQQSLLSIIQAVNCCFGGLQGRELCYQAVSLLLNFCFTAFWLLLFRQHQLLVLKTVPLEPGLHGEMPWATGSWIASFGRCEWMAEFGTLVAVTKGC